MRARRRAPRPLLRRRGAAASAATAFGKRKRKKRRRKRRSGPRSSSFVVQLGRLPHAPSVGRVDASKNSRHAVSATDGAAAALTITNKVQVRRAASTRPSGASTAGAWRRRSGASAPVTSRAQSRPAGSSCARGTTPARRRARPFFRRAATAPVGRQRGLSDTFREGAVCGRSAKSGS